MSEKERQHGISLEPLLFKSPSLQVGQGREAESLSFSELYLKEELGKVHMFLTDAISRGVLPSNYLCDCPALKECWSKEEEESFIAKAKKDRFSLIKSFAKEYPGESRFTLEDLMENMAIIMIPSTRQALIDLLPQLNPKLKQAILLSVFFNFDVFRLRELIGIDTDASVGRIKNKIFDVIEPGFRNKHYVEECEATFNMVFFKDNPVNKNIEGDLSERKPFYKELSTEEIIEITKERNDGRGLLPEDVPLEVLAARLESLNARMKKFFLQHELEGLTQKEIASIEDIGSSTVSEDLKCIKRILAGETSPVELHASYVNKLIAKTILTEEVVDVPDGLSRKILIERYQELSSLEKRAIRMRYIGAKKVSEVASAINIGKSTVDSLLGAAFLFLKTGERPKKQKTYRSKNQKRGEEFARIILDGKEQESFNGLTREQIIENYNFLNHTQKRIFTIVCIRRQTLKLAAMDLNISYDMAELHLRRLIETISGERITRINQRKKQIKALFSGQVGLDNPICQRFSLLGSNDLELLYKRYVLGLTAEQIAIEKGVHWGTIYAHIRSSLRFLGIEVATIKKERKQK